jgi:hypothetical protein
MPRPDLKLTIPNSFEDLERLGVEETADGPSPAVAELPPDEVAPRSRLEDHLGLPLRRQRTLLQRRCKFYPAVFNRCR